MASPLMAAEVESSGGAATTDNLRRAATTATATLTGPADLP